MATFWISWWLPGDSDFKIDWPWWITGVRMSDDAESVCAAVAFESLEAAKYYITTAHTEVPAGGLEWRIAEEMTDPDWSPYSDRFPKSDWMPDFPLVASSDTEPVVKPKPDIYRLSDTGEHPKMDGQSRYRIEPIGKPGAVGFVYLQPDVADALREQLKRTWVTVEDQEDDGW